MPVATNDARDLDLVLLARAVWTEFPLMATISLFVALACAPAAIAMVVVVPLAPLVAAVTLGPVWIGAVALAGDALAGNAVGPRDLLLAVRRWARTGIGIAIVPAVVTTLLIGSVAVRSANPDQRWLLVPIVVDATALVVLALGCFAVFPLAVVSGQRGRDRWLTALALAGQDLTTTLGLTALLVLMALSTRLVGPTPALILAGPLAMLATAATRRSIALATLEDDS